jgi:hypothetical protein
LVVFTARSYQNGNPWSGMWLVGHGMGITGVFDWCSVLTLPHICPSPLALPRCLHAQVCLTQSGTLTGQKNSSSPTLDSVSAAHWMSCPAPKEPTTLCCIADCHCSQQRWVYCFVPMY